MSENYIELFEKFTKTDNFNDVPLLGDIASALILNRLFDEFGKILTNLDVSKLNILKRNEKFLRGMIAFYYEKRCFKQVYELLEKGEFSDYTGLIDLWDDAHYAEKEIQIGKPLTPLMKFRTRQKFPPPRNISPSGERPTKKLSDEAKSVLKTWMSKNSLNPYPSQEVREELANKAGVTHYQVKTWFANARRRLKLLTERTEKHYELYVQKKRDLLNIEHQRKDHTKTEKDDIEYLFDSNNTNPSTTRKSVISQTGALPCGNSNLLSKQLQPNLSNFGPLNTVLPLCATDQNNNISVNTGPDAIRKTNYSDSAERVDVVPNQFHPNCLQHLAELCRNINYRDNSVCAFNNQRYGNQFSLGGLTEHHGCVMGNNNQHMHQSRDINQSNQPAMERESQCGTFSQYHPYEHNPLENCFHGQNSLAGHVISPIVNPSFQQKTLFCNNTRFPFQSNVHRPNIDILSSTSFPSNCSQHPHQTQNFAQRWNLPATHTSTLSNIQTSHLWTPPNTQTSHPWIQSRLADTLGFSSPLNTQVPSTPKRQVPSTSNKQVPSPPNRQVPSTPNRHILESFNETKTDVTVARPSSCPLPMSEPSLSAPFCCHGTQNALPNFYPQTKQDLRLDNLQLEEESNAALSQCNDEEDVAKVLLDLSSQHSSQESS